MRKAHYLPPNKSSESPQACIWVDTETKPITKEDGKDYHYLWFGWAVYQRVRKGDKWTKEEWIRFTTIREFWDWVETKVRPKNRLYIFAHNGAFDLPVLDGFGQMIDRGYQLTGAVADAPPLILTWKQENKTIRFVDTLNIWRAPLSDIGESVGLRKLRMPDRSASKARWDAYGRRDVKVIWRACRAWFSFLRDNDLGGFKPTLASQAFAAYRHRFMPCRILIDEDQESLDISRDSYVGGRTECFRMGEYKGDFYYLDVNSMYPSVMRDNKFPSMILGTYTNIEDNEIPRLMNDVCSVVQCTVTTDEPVYPLIKDGRLIFPIGTFDVTLATPEFKYAIEQGHVKEIRKAAVYKPDNLFHDFIVTLYELRMEARAKGDTLNTWLYKILMNSLYGKFGQRGRHYKDVGIYDPDIIEVWEEYDMDSNTLHAYRAFGGLLQEYENEGESYNSLPAIASHVTSYARMILWNAIKTAGISNCYYCDTDSIIVNREGYDRVKHLIDPNELGKWSLEKTGTTLDIRGAKDYAFDTDNRTKGVRHNAIWLSSNEVKQDQFVGLKGLLRRGELTAPIVFSQNKKLSRKYYKGNVMDDGRVLPFIIGD